MRTVNHYGTAGCASVTWDAARRELEERSGARWREHVGHGARTVGVASFAAALLLCVMTGAAPAQEGSPPAEAERMGAVDVETAPRPVARAVRADGAIVIDGFLDEPVWQRADVIGGFVQSQPNTGYPATERTEVRIVYDSEYLYVGATLHESRRDRRTVTTLERDMPGSNTRDSDVFGIALDTFLDRRNSFIFLVNPMGALRDGQTFDDSRTLNIVWRAAVRVETRVTEEGWAVEMAIPWSALRFDPSLREHVFGMNLLRRVRWKNEDSYWAPVDRHDPVHRMSRAGTLVGLEGIRSGRDLRLKPYTAASHARGAAVDPGDLGGSVKLGGDLKYGITPGLTLDLTMNTDFSQVEVDQERVNLTRFSLFLPEQRDFFVENSGDFAFGDVTEREYRMGSSLQDFTLFHSRRIGLTPDGRPVPILGGGRVTGRAGAYQLGLLNMQTRPGHGLPAENFTVARVRRTVGTGSDVGFLVVNRQSTGSGADGYNRSVGADANLRFFRHLILNGYVAGTDSDDGGDDRFAARLSAAWRDRFLNTSAFVRHVGTGFDPGLGFVRRPGVRHHYATVGVHPRPAWPHVQEVNPYVEFHYVTEPGSVTATRTGTVGLEVEFLDGGEASVEASDRFERLLEPFTLRDDAVVAAGSYSFREATLSYESSRARSLSARAAIAGGEFFHGDRRSASLQARWRPTYRWALDVSADHNRITLPDSPAFTADVVGSRINYAQSTSLFASAYVQYNTSTQHVVTSVRLNYIHAPLSDLFLVYTERRVRAGDRTLERVVSLKVTRSFSF